MINGLGCCRVDFASKEVVGYAEHLAELPLGNAGSFRDIALDHVVAQPQQDLAMERGLGTVFLAVAAICAGRRDRNPGVGNRGFHLQHNSLPVWSRRRPQSNTKFRLKGQKMNAK